VVALFYRRQRWPHYVCGGGRGGGVGLLGPGLALDNAVIESWHSTVEFELRRIEQFPGKAAAWAGVAACIEDCNHERRHSALGMLSPVDYERALAGKDAA